MHDAAWENNVEIINVLLELGADPTIRDGDHQGTPLDWAEYNHRHEAANCLRKLTNVT